MVTVTKVKLPIFAPQSTPTITEEGKIKMGDMARREAHNLDLLILDVADVKQTQLCTGGFSSYLLAFIDCYCPFCSISHFQTSELSGLIIAIGF